MAKVPVLVGCHAVAEGVQCDCDVGDEFKITLHCPYDGAEIVAPDFTLGHALVFKKNVGERDVSVLAKDGKMVGWIIPVYALGQRLEERAGDPNFLWAVGVAYYLLLSGIEVPLTCIRPGIDWQSVTRISDIFDENLCVVLVNKDGLGGAFQVDSFLPSFYRAGFIACGELDSSHLVREFGSAPSRINLEGVVAGEAVVLGAVALIKNVIPYQKDVVARFFYAYQIIEILSQKVFFLERDRASEKLISAGEDFVSVKGAIEAIRGQFNEEARLQKLLQIYLPGVGAQNEMLRVFNAYLESVGADQFGDFGSALYQVRNRIFHGYGFLHGRGGAELLKLVESFEDYILDAVYGFSYPRVA